MVYGFKIADLSHKQRLADPAKQLRRVVARMTRLKLSETDVSVYFISQDSLLLHSETRIYLEVRCFATNDTGRTEFDRNVLAERLVAHVKKYFPKRHVACEVVPLAGDTHSGYAVDSKIG